VNLIVNCQGLFDFVSFHWEEYAVRQSIMYEEEEEVRVSPLRSNEEAEKGEKCTFKSLRPLKAA